MSNGRCPPVPSPGEKVVRPSESEEIAGRKRNAGGKPKVCTSTQTSTRVATKTAHRWRSLDFYNRYIAARIPLQSGNRFRRADFLTASPRGKRFGVLPCKNRPRKTGGGQIQGIFTLCSVTSPPSEMVTIFSVSSLLRSTVRVQDSAIFSMGSHQDEPSCATSRL